MSQTFHFPESLLQPNLTVYQLLNKSAHVKDYFIGQYKEYFCDKALDENKPMYIILIICRQKYDFYAAVFVL